jgi:hypothetical protein
MTTRFRRSYGSNTASPPPVGPRRASLRHVPAEGPGYRLGANPAVPRRASLRHFSRPEVNEVLGDLIRPNHIGPHRGPMWFRQDVPVKAG